MSILVTGGAGFIGSHTCVELLNAGYDVVIVDNLYNASEKAVDRVKEITGKDLKFYQVDIRDREGLNEVFDKEDVESVIHFAGLKAVGESVQKPLEYYENNIGGTITLCDVMRSHGSKKHYFQFFGNSIRGSGIYSDHGRVSKGCVYKSIWMDKMDVRADFDRSSYGRSGVERSASSLFQSDRSA